MTDEVYKVKFYYYTDDEGNTDLYGWSTKKEIWKMFEKTRDMSKFTKKTKSVYGNEMQDLFYEYGDKFIDTQIMKYSDRKIKIAMTKGEKIHVENIINVGFINMQTAVVNLDMKIFSNDMRKRLNTIGMDKCMYSLSLNSPAIQTLFTSQEAAIFISEYNHFLSKDFTDKIEYVD